MADIFSQLELIGIVYITHEIKQEHLLIPIKLMENGLCL